MKFTRPRKALYYKYDLDYDEKEGEALKKYAIEKFSTDEQAQIEYAIVNILKETLEKEVEDTKKKSKKIKKNKE